MSAEPEPLRVSLEVWHPDCWTIETTEAVDVGILGRVVARDVGSRSTAFVTLYADRRRELDDAIETIRSSPHVHDATRVPRTGPGSDHARPGNATTDLLIDHEASSQISGAFLSRDFVHARPVDTRDGSEQWVLLTKQTRDGVTESLDEITDAHDADITVTGISRTADDTNAARFSLTSLSARQREVFELARARGYYEWPKQISASDLAAELDIATATLHEHLHKAEAKLLGAE
ncbi:helix-turn-helix domain-containing protein [Haloarculaceae archaeon H-GB2-1]|nr:helix-turn-helix domain-containing protein [Haloarculaceae archaeon H-GB1-1]MEA5406815.1 helix-turn-helix domain-containing protein [Haloarculaceae archaeon H-GB2-1]